MRNVYKMTFDFCAFGTNCENVQQFWLATYSSDVWALHTMRCHGHKRCSFTGEKARATRWIRLFSSMVTYTQKHNVSGQTRESAFGTHPNAKNMER